MMRLHPRQLAIFLMALALAIVAGLLGAPWPLVWMQPPLAMLLAMLWRTPRWWWLLHLLLLPAVFFAMQADLPLGYIAGRAAAVCHQPQCADRAGAAVPDVTGRADALAARLPPLPGTDRSGLWHRPPAEGLSRRRPDLILHGVESAWLPWLWARLRLARRPNVSVTLVTSGRPHWLAMG